MAGGFTGSWRLRWSARTGTCSIRSRARSSRLASTRSSARIPTLARHGVIVAFAQLVAAIGDGHTNIYPTRDPQIAFHTLPVSFTFFGDDLYVRAAHRSQQSLIGARVVRIGNHNTADAYTLVRSMVGHDNEQGVRYWAQYLLAMPEVLHALQIASNAEDVSLVVSTERGGKSPCCSIRIEPVPIMTGRYRDAVQSPGGMGRREGPRGHGRSGVAAAHERSVSLSASAEASSMCS